MKECLFAFDKASLARGSGLDGLAECFCDSRLCLVLDTPTHSIFRVVPNLERLVKADPALTSNLARSFGLVPENLGGYKRLYRNGERLLVVSLDYCWALWAWSIWLSTLNVSAKSLLMHFDAHDDLALPATPFDVNLWRWVQPLSGESINLLDPVSIENAIHLRVIGIGNFIAPLLLHCSGSEMLHFSPYQGVRRFAFRSNAGASIQHENHAQRGFADFSIVETLQQPAFDLGLAATVVNKAVDRCVLLGIDLDYVCNSKDDANVDNQEHMARRMIVERFDRFGQWLRASGIVRRASVITLKLSPGFFPSDFWDAGLDFVNMVIKDGGFELTHQITGKPYTGRQ